MDKEPGAQVRRWRAFAVLAVSFFMTVVDLTIVNVALPTIGAHKTVTERLPEQSQQATLRSLGDNALSEIVERYVAAWERSDVDAVVAMLTEDARMTMPPLPTWYSGREQIAAFLAGQPLSGQERWRLIPARASGQVAFGCYVRDEEMQAFTPHAVNVFTLRGGQIEEIAVFLTPGAFPRFGLPGSIC